MAIQARIKILDIGDRPEAKRRGVKRIITVQTDKPFRFMRRFSALPEDFGQPAGLRQLLGCRTENCPQYGGYDRLNDCPEIAPYYGLIDENGVVIHCTGIARPLVNVSSLPCARKIGNGLTVEF